jgi:hypothetical protein
MKRRVSVDCELERCALAPRQQLRRAKKQLASGKHTILVSHTLQSKQYQHWFVIEINNDSRQKQSTTAITPRFQFASARASRAKTKKRRTKSLPKNTENIDPGKSNNKNQSNQSQRM